MLNCTSKLAGSLRGVEHALTPPCLDALTRDMRYWQSIIVSTVSSAVLIKTGVLSLNAQLASAAAAVSSSGSAAGHDLSVGPADVQAAAEATFRFAQRGTAFNQASHVAEPTIRRALGSAVARRLVAEYAALGSAAVAVWGDAAPPMPCTAAELGALLGAQDEEEGG